MKGQHESCGKALSVPALNPSLVGGRPAVAEGTQQPRLAGVLVRDSRDEAGSWAERGHFEAVVGVGLGQGIWVLFLACGG